MVKLAKYRVILLGMMVLLMAYCTTREATLFVGVQTGDGDGCGSGQTLCNNYCAYTDSDPANCGRCGVSCPQGQGCLGGNCVCPSQVPDYCASKATCVNKQTDRNNCGNCDNVCPSTQNCVNGGCTEISILGNSQNLPSDVNCSATRTGVPEYLSPSDLWNGDPNLATGSGLAITEMMCRIEAEGGSKLYRSSVGIGYISCLDNSGWFGQKQSWQTNELAFLSIGFNLYGGPTPDAWLAKCSKCVRNQLACSSSTNEFLNRFNGNCGAIPSPILNASDGGCKYPPPPSDPNGGGSGQSSFSADDFIECSVTGAGGCPSACDASCCVAHCGANQPDCLVVCQDAQYTAIVTFNTLVAPLGFQMTCGDCKNSR